MTSAIDIAIQCKRDIERLTARHGQHDPGNPAEENMKQKDLVRFFGDKVKTVRWSRRFDLVGLLILGKHAGIYICRNEKNERVVRLVEIKVNGEVNATTKDIILHNSNSLTNVCRGLLNWVY